MIICLLSHGSILSSRKGRKVASKFGIVLDGQHFVVDVHVGIRRQLSCNKQLSKQKRVCEINARDYSENTALTLALAVCLCLRWPKLIAIHTSQHHIKNHKQIVRTVIV